MARSEVEIQEEIELYKDARAKALQSISYTIGGELSVQRPNIEFLEKRLQELRTELETVQGTSRGVRTFGVVL